MRTSFRDRCDAIEAEARKKPPYLAWGPGAFMPPVFAEADSPTEAHALEFLKVRFPDAIAISVLSVVDLLVEFKERHDAR